MARQPPSNISSRTKQILQLALAQPVDSDSDVDSDDSYVPEQSDLEISEHESDSEFDEEDDTEEEEVQLPTWEQSSTSAEQHSTFQQVENVGSGGTKDVYYGKKRCFAWHSQPVKKTTQAIQRNIIKVRLSQPHGPARTIGPKPTPLQIWNLLFTSEMIDIIVEATNSKLEKMRSKIKHQNSVCYKNTNRTEINALIGIVLLCR